MGRAPETIEYHRRLDAGERPDHKWCATCSAWLPLADFGRDRTRKDGLAPCCRECARSRSRRWGAANTEKRAAWSEQRLARLSPSERAAQWRRHKYGITDERYNQLLADQGGVCAICKRLPASGLVVDHCHRTGAVRGLLCYACNRSLFIIEDRRLRSAAADYVDAFDRADAGAVGSAEVT